MLISFDRRYPQQSLRKQNHPLVYRPSKCLLWSQRLLSELRGSSPRLLPRQPAAAPSTTRTTSSSSRLTSQTVSSMQNQSDASLRSRNQIPTIAGSPSVGTNSSQTSKEAKEPPPSSLMYSVSGNPNETPTKIPRIASRTSAGASPTLKNSVSILTSRRASINVNGFAASTNASPIELSTNEFGVMENGDAAKTASGLNRHTSIRGSPSTNSSSRVPRQASTSTSTVQRWQRHL